MTQDNSIDHTKIKVKWLGKTTSLMLTNGKIYDVISIEKTGIE